MEKWVEQLVEGSSGLIWTLIGAAVIALAAVVWNKGSKKLPFFKRVWDGVDKSRGAAVFVLVVVLGCVAIQLVGVNMAGAEADGPEQLPSPVASPSASDEPLVKTEVRESNAVDYDGTIRAGYDVETTATGYCDGPSAVRPEDKNAYRCVAEAGIADPCLALAEGTAVFCLKGPWDHAGMRMDLEDPVAFDPSFDFSSVDQARPWAIEVVDPHDAAVTWRCVAMGVASATPVNGHYPTYWCRRPDGSGDARGLDHLIKDGPLWEVLFADPERPDNVQAKVAVVWN